MKNVNIIIPVTDYEEAERYYRLIFPASSENGTFLLPVESKNIAIKIMIIDEEAKDEFPPRKHFPIFGYILERNFLSYCNEIFAKGAHIETACATPGGYYARVSDPFGNQFEIECNNFEETDPTIDTSKLPFFYSY